MSYPSYTPVHTYTLPTVREQLASPVIVVARHTDGEVTMREFSDYREAQTYADDVDATGGRVLVAVEGETDLTTGEATVWMRR